MQFYLNVFVLFTVLFSYTIATIDFMDCGSDNIDIDTVSIEGCESCPCFLRRGQPYNVTITPHFLDPQIDKVDLDVKAYIRGAMFDVNATFFEPCGLPCPIDDRVVTPHIPITVKLDTKLIRGPAELIINATYMNGRFRRSSFCIEIDMSIG